MSRRNRRQFLEDSMFAAAAAAMAGPAGHLLAADVEPRAKGPNERLNVAVVGVNGRGNSHITHFAGRKDNPDTMITWVVDVDSQVGNRRAGEIEKKQDGVRPKFAQDIRK